MSEREKPKPVPHYSTIDPGPEATDLDRLAEYGAEVAKAVSKMHPPNRTNVVKLRRRPNAAECSSGPELAKCAPNRSRR